MSQVREQPSPATIQPPQQVAILRARGLRRAFKMGDSTVAVLKGVDITVRPGEFIAIEGRSGSGKSTLLHLLGALDSVDDGTVEFDGRDYTRKTQGRPPTAPERFLTWLSEGYADLGLGWKLLAVVLLALGLYAAWIYADISVADRGTGIGLSVLAAPMFVFGIGLLLWVLRIAVVWGLRIARFAGSFVIRPVRTVRDAFERRRLTGFATELRNRQFGFVFQFYHLVPEFTVLENTLLSKLIEHSAAGYMATPGLEKRAIELLDQLGLGHRLKHRPAQLSGGERQRVAIARALMNSPRVLFADEPTGNLDFETGQQIMGVLEKLHREQGQTIVMVTHDRALARTADRVLVLKDGKLEKAG